MSHWTDHVTTHPIFSTVIDARGPRGNVVSIVSACTSMLHDLRIPYETIQAFSNATVEADDYEAVIALVEKWFKVDRSE